MSNLEEMFVTGLVYDYLLKKDSSLANVFQKKTKAPILSKGSPSIVEVYRYFQKNSTKKVSVVGVNKESSSNSSSDSEELTPKNVAQVNGKQAVIKTVPLKKVAESSASSEEEDSSSDDDKEAAQKVLNKAKINIKPPLVQKEESSDESSDEEETSTVQTKANRNQSISSVKADSKGVQHDKNKQPINKQSLTPALKKQESSDSSSDSSDDEKPSIKQSINKPTKVILKEAVPAITKKVNLPAKSVTKPESSSSEDSSDEEETVPKKTVLGKPTAAKKESSSEESSSESSECEKGTKAASLKAQSQKPALGQTSKLMTNSTPKAQPMQKQIKSSETSTEDSSDEEHPPIKSTLNESASRKLAVTKEESSSEDSSEEEQSVKKSTILQLITKKESTSSEDTSEDDSPIEKPSLKQNTITKIITSKVGPAKKKSSSEDSDVDSDEQEKLATKPLTQPLAKRSDINKALKKQKSSSDDSDDSENKTPVAKSTPKAITKKESSSDSDSDSSKEKEDETKVQVAVKAQKRKHLNDNEGATPTKFKKSYDNFVKANNSLNEDNKLKRFQRVRSDEIRVDPKLANNSFEAKKGARGSWGERANEVLKHTRGKLFRHEKQKKKRGSYRGGRIDTHVNSIKFDD